MLQLTLRDEFDKAITLASGGTIRLPGYAVAPREGLKRPPLGRRFIDSCGRAFSALVPRGALVALPSRGSIIAVCSPNRGEGRSTVAAGLATAIAHNTGEDTLLLDLDFSHPKQAQLFGVVASPGVADFVAGTARLRLVAGGPERNLWLAPAGDPVRETPRLFHELGESGLLAAARERFGWIVLDLPPALDHPEAAAAWSQAEFKILVARHRSTTQNALKRTLGTVGTGRRTGCLLTNDQSQIPAWLRRLL